MLEFLELGWLLELCPLKDVSFIKRFYLGGFPQIEGDAVVAEECGCSRSADDEPRSLVHLPLVLDK